MKKLQNINIYASFLVVCFLITGCTEVVEDKYADKEFFNDSGLTVSSLRGSVDTVSIISNTSHTVENTSHTVKVQAFSRKDDIDTKDISPESIVAFAQTLIGIPYKYGSTDPDEGFDCSGFITYVFNHFDIAVPRSSIDFTDVGEEVSRRDVKSGDLILFTGTNPSVRKVGHMGIVTFTNPEKLLFIHSTSGKLYSVTVTPMSDYYQSRFVKFVRIFKEKNRRLSRR